MQWAIWLKGRVLTCLPAWDNTVITPARGVLEGVTRATILELLTAREIASEAGSIDHGDSTNSRRGIHYQYRGWRHADYPDREVDPVGDGRPGALTVKLNDAYWALHDDPRFSTAIEY